MGQHKRKREGQLSSSLASVLTRHFSSLTCLFVCFFLNSIFTNCSFYFKIIWHIRRSSHLFCLCLLLCCFGFCNASSLLLHLLSVGIGLAGADCTFQQQCVPPSLNNPPPPALSMAHPAGVGRMQRSHSDHSSETESTQYQILLATGCIPHPLARRLHSASSDLQAAFSILWPRGCIQHPLTRRLHSTSSGISSLGTQVQHGP